MLCGRFCVRRASFCPRLPPKWNARDDADSFGSPFGRLDLEPAVFAEGQIVLA